MRELVLLVDKVKKAIRSKHERRCEVCKHLIEPGEHYRCQTWRRGKFFNIAYHLGCFEGAPQPPKSTEKRPRKPKA